MNDLEISVAVRETLDSQLFGVLATTGNEGVHTTIVAFATADDFRSILFATPAETRKLANLTSQDRVSLLVDDRKNDPDSIMQIHGVEARGRATVLSEEERQVYEPIYLAKHEILSRFLSGSILVRIVVDAYDVVHRFQNVIALSPEQL
jgi:nitroimidazol reductase NimA-like FMN-containing flavoprotein (pyridoxamine 5'-phosphate oxidase superfamily)